MSKFEYKPGMKKYEVLKEAMKYLDTKSYSHPYNKYEFICNCINKVVHNNPICFKDGTGLLAVINDHLLPHDTLNNWLYYKHSISFEEQNADEGRKLQYTRKMWMQSMYEEFLAKDE